ncbi:MAG: M56 family metallopeptidase [Thermoanaerobaculia bacterium]
MDMERRHWVALWIRAAPALGVALGLLAWAAVEPYNAERLALPAWGVVLVGAIVWSRALLRAVRSLAIPEGQVVAGTLGLLRPRIVFSAQFQSAVDAAALRAAHAHEAAHARHRDPLRIWLTQFATDLLWPWKAARQRFRTWRYALELARDEEAVAAEGIEGADLAAAIVAAARLHPRSQCALAALVGDAALLEARVNLLLHRAPFRSARSAAACTATAVVVLALAIWIALGATLGETLVEPFLLR